MIKETKKITKYNEVKSKNRILLEYVVTFGLSVLVAVIITSILAMHARNEMIKNIYASETAKSSAINASVAKMMTENMDYLEDLDSKKYETCMYVGDLYAAAGDYIKAKYAYELAVSKSKMGVYKAHYKLICVLLEQQNFDKADSLLEYTTDRYEKNLIKFKVRSYITMGDKYYSIGKFLSAAKAYERAAFYYDKFKKKDKTVEESIRLRITKSYTGVGDLMVSSGMNEDALRFLRKAEQYSPEDFNVKYRIGIVLSDADPEEAVKYFEPILEEEPQNIDYGVYSSALMKAANIADLDNRPTMAKYYRYKIHSVDLFVNRKVVYKNDIEVIMDPPTLRKVFFRYPIKLKYHFINASQSIVKNLYADFVLTENDKPIETINITLADRRNPFVPGENDVDAINVNFKKKVFAKKDLDAYSVKIYVYKDKKYKTLVAETKVKL